MLVGIPPRDFATQNSRFRGPAGAVPLYNKVLSQRTCLLSHNPLCCSSTPHVLSRYTQVLCQAVAGQEKFIKLLRTNKQHPNSWVFLFCSGFKANKFLHPLHTQTPEICKCSCTTKELTYTGTKSSETTLNTRLDIARRLGIRKLQPDAKFNLFCSVHSHTI